MDRQRREDEEEFIPIGRAENIVINRIRGRGGHSSPAPTNPGWGLMAFARGRGWRPASSSSVERPGNLPQAFGRSSELSPLLTQELHNTQQTGQGPYPSERNVQKQGG